MGSIYVEELGRELTGRELDIWRGNDDDGQPIDMPSAKQEQYRQLWRRQAKLSKGAVRPEQQPRNLCGCRPAEAPPRAG